MYDIDLLKGIQRRRGGGSGWALLLLAAGALLFAAQHVILREASGRWEARAAVWEEELREVEREEEVLLPSLDDRLHLTQRRANRVLWQPLLTRLADLLPAEQAWESVRYDGEDQVMVLEMRGWGEAGARRFVTALRSDTLFSRFFARAEDPVPAGGGRFRIVCFREEEG